MPAAGVTGALTYYAANGIGGNLGVLVIFLVLVAAATAFYLASRRTPVNSESVNDDWTGTPTAAPPELATTTTTTTAA